MLMKKTFSNITVCFRNPDTASVKNKMVYAASNDAVRKAIGNAVGVAVQATDQGELDECEVCDKIRSTDRA